MLPAALCVLPFEPGGGCAVGDAVEDAGFVGGELLVDALAVEKGAAGGNGEEIEAHCKGSCLRAIDSYRCNWQGREIVGSSSVW